MKVTSIIFLFISIAFILGGMFLMREGRKQAPNDLAIDGYEWDEDGVNISEISLAEDEINKYSVILSDCNVEIYSDKEASSVRMTNFKPNKYTASVSGKSFTVSDDISITDYISFDGTGVKFAGVWKTLLSEYNSYKYKNTDKRTLRINIADYSELKQISLNLTGCNLRIHDITGECDLKITATNSNIEMTNLQTSLVVLDGSESVYSMLNVKTDKFNVTVKKGSLESRAITAGSISLESEEANISLLESGFRTLNANFTEGDLVFETIYDMSSYARKMVSEDGILYINEMNAGSSFSSDEGIEYAGSIEISVGKGLINAKFGKNILLPEKPAEEKPTDDGKTSTDTDDSGSDNGQNNGN